MAKKKEENYFQEKFKEHLETEIKACLDDMARYQKEMTKAEKQGDTDRFKMLEQDLKQANEQYHVAKQELKEKSLELGY